MLRINKGVASIRGSRRELIADFMTLGNVLVDREVVSRADLQLYTAMAVSTEEEMKEAIKNTVDEMDDISEALKLLSLIAN